MNTSCAGNDRITPKLIRQLKIRMSGVYPFDMKCAFMSISKEVFLDMRCTWEHIVVFSSFKPRRITRQK